MKNLVPALLLAALLPLPALAASEAQTPDVADGFMKQFDTNKDGKVSADEFKKPQLDAMEHQIDKQFQYMDKDHNGGVDKAEVETFANELHQRMKQIQEEHSKSSDTGK